VFELILSLCLGIVFALCARDRIRADGRFASPAFMLVLVFTGVVLLPATLYIYLAFPAWSWLYMVNPSDVPALALVPLLAAHAGVLLGGWFLGARLVMSDQAKLGIYLAGGATLALLVVSAILWNRVGTSGSYEEFQAGSTSGMFKVRLGYVLICLVLGAGAAASFVALELNRDSRRVRSR